MLTIMVRMIEGRTALVTGASSGIGAAVARRLAREGARVALLARRADRLAELERELRSEGATAAAFVADVGIDEEVAGAVAGVREQLGRVDLIVHAAGSYAYGPVEHADLADWEAMFGSSLWGTALLTRRLVDDLTASATEGAADVICVSSVAANRPYPGFAIYGAAKAAVEQFAVALRAELAPSNVRVCTIELGLVDTEPAMAFAAAGGEPPPALSPDDVADLVAYIVGRPASVSFGHILALPTAQA